MAIVEWWRESALRRQAQRNPQHVLEAWLGPFGFYMRLQQDLAMSLVVAAPEFERDGMLDLAHCHNNDGDL